MSGEKACPFRLTVTRGWAPLRPRGPPLSPAAPCVSWDHLPNCSPQSIPGAQGQRLVEQDVRPSMR